MTIYYLIYLYVFFILMKSKIHQNDIFCVTMITNQNDYVILSEFEYSRNIKTPHFKKS